MSSWNFYFLFGTHKNKMYLPPIVQTISKTLAKQNAKAIVVGGSVRDYFLKLPIKDYDIEVFGIESIEELEEFLSSFGSVNIVGKSFGVVKFYYDGEEYDFSLPRRDEKVGEGHRGFEVTIDTQMNFTQASQRRDFTINAMGYDIESKKFIDPHNAEDDMRDKILRHIDDMSFVEDPLRVYRAIQFCARFSYTLADETFDLCKQMVEDGSLSELPKERLYTEWTKLLLKSPKPSIGFELMLSLGVLQYFPELEAIIAVPQSVKWHPEGDVWVHTLMCVDEMVALLGDDERQNLRYMFAILCHDLGKATATTIESDGRIRAIDHEYQGIAPTKSLLYRLTDEHDFIDTISPLVEQHLKPSQFYQGKSRDKAIRKLATKVNIKELIVVAKADFLGRTTEEALEGIYYAGEWLEEKSKNLKVENKPLDNLLQGRDLIALGLTPSPKFSEILNRVYELQLDGILEDRDGALRWVSRFIKE
ncbi:MAG: hypothetical protein QM493_10995 [Sulfurovum sp.]